MQEGQTAWVGEVSQMGVCEGVGRLIVPVGSAWLIISYAFNFSFSVALSLPRAEAAEQGAPWGNRERRSRRGPAAEPALLFPFPLQLLPQSGAVCWSLQTFLSLQNTGIVSVCE